MRHVLTRRSQHDFTLSEFARAHTVIVRVLTAAIELQEALRRMSERQPNVGSSLHTNVRGSL
jgi:hypothetical protein